jgi:hypothetical protein
MYDEGWRVKGGEWKVEDGGWRVKGGEWKVEGGGWRVEDGGGLTAQMSASSRACINQAHNVSC